MNSETALLGTLTSDFEVESEIFRIKKAMLSPNQDKMLRWMVSSQILDYVAEQFKLAGLSPTSVADLRKSCIGALKSESAPRRQIAMVISCLTAAGFKVEADPKVAVKLALLWLIIEGVGPQKSKKSAANNVSYKWKGSSTALSALYNELLGSWIDEATTFSQFEAVFAAQPLSGINPVRWNSNYLSEVIYFITVLHDSRLVGSPENLLRMDHQRLASCFVKANGEAFRNIKQVKNNHRFTLSDSKKEAIDALVKRISASNWSSDAG